MNQLPPKLTGPQLRAYVLGSGLSLGEAAACAGIKPSRMSDSVGERHARLSDIEWARLVRAVEEASARIGVRVTTTTEETR